MGGNLETLNEKIYNSRIFFSYIGYLRDNHPHVDISKLLNFAGIDPSSIDDPLEWYSQEQTNRFSEYLSSIFDDPTTIAREAGRYAYKDKVLGLFKQFSFKLLGVGYLYKNISKYANALTKSCEFSSRELASNKYEITVEFKPHIEENPLQEYNRLGFLEAAPLLFSQKMAKIECPWSDKTVKYIITWAAPRSKIVDKYRAYFCLISVIVFIAAYYNEIYSNFYLLFALPAISLFALLTLTIIKEKLKYQELNNLHLLHEKGADQIIQQYIDDYRQVNMLNRIGRIILSEGSDNNYLKGIANTLIDLKYKNVSFFIADFNDNKIVNKYNHGYQSSVVNSHFEQFRIKSHIKHLLSVAYINKPTLLESKLPLFSGLSFRETDFPLVFVPIIYGDSPLGFFFVTPHESLIPIGKKKSDFLMGVASQIALGIHKQHAFYEIAESDRIKTEFIATASHELKTPVQTLMSGLSELGFTKDIDNTLPLLKKVSGKMALQITNLLSLHRIESKHYSLDVRPVTLTDILAKIEDSAQANASVYSHFITFEGFDSKETGLSVDIERISSAILNLINNSCKYTPAGGTIKIKYSKGRSEHKISVMDNGIGIAPKYQDKIFIKFYQVSNSDRIPTGGIGLGLSIVKEIVSLHNGDITVKSPLPLNLSNIPLGGERIGTIITINLPVF